MKIKLVGKRWCRL